MGAGEARAVEQRQEHPHGTMQRPSLFCKGSLRTPSAEHEKSVRVWWCQADLESRRKNAIVAGPEISHVALNMSSPLYFSGPRSSSESLLPLPPSRACARLSPVGTLGRFYKHNTFHTHVSKLLHAPFFVGLPCRQPPAPPPPSCEHLDRCVAQLGGGGRRNPLLLRGLEYCGEDGSSAILDSSRP